LTATSVRPAESSSLAARTTSMPSSYRSKYGPMSARPTQERRRQPRTEDKETAAMIRRYMELAKKALNGPPFFEGEDGHPPGKKKAA
jgi:hypothetical protein